MNHLPVEWLTMGFTDFAEQYPLAHPVVNARPFFVRHITRVWLAFRHAARVGHLTKSA
jgi:hypothetical protein